MTQSVRRPLVVGNWKMNPQTVSMTRRLVREVKAGIARVQGVDVVITPPAPFLAEAKTVHNGSKKFTLGAQNTHWAKLGAHTGEVSLPMLKNFNVTHVIIGHSERRAAGETDTDIHKKVMTTLKAGATAILCVGEKERDTNGHYLTHIEEQIRKDCAGVAKAKLAKLVIAYEPIWAIGTGDTATPEDAHEMKLFIRKVLTNMYGRNLAHKVKILYGGSVNARNAAALMEEGTVDGLLVGGASLRSEEFVEIVKASKRP